MARKVEHGVAPQGFPVLHISEESGALPKRPGRRAAGFTLSCPLQTRGVFQNPGGLQTRMSGSLSWRFSNRSPTAPLRPPPERRERSCELEEQGVCAGQPHCSCPHPKGRNFWDGQMAHPSSSSFPKPQWVGRGKRGGLSRVPARAPSVHSL